LTQATAGAMTAEIDFDTLFTTARTIAVVGLSPDPARPSHDVARTMQREGFRIFAVNPLAAGTTILGERCHADLVDISEPVDIVDCFRRSDAMLAVAREAAAMQPRPMVLWMQRGIANDAAARVARDAGIAVVSDRCLAVDYLRWRATR